MSDDLRPVTLLGLGEDRFGYDFALLVDDEGRRLPLWMGRCQALAIHFKLQATQWPRPMTHDLLSNSVERLGGRVTRVIIDDLWQNTFYAKVCLVAGEDEQEMQIDCRPSDAVALAIRVGAPILVRDDVLEEGKVPQPLPTDPEDEDDAV